MPFLFRLSHQVVRLREEQDLLGGCVVMPLLGFQFTSLRHQSTTPEQGELSEDRDPQEVVPRLSTLATVRATLTLQLPVSKPFLPAA